MGTVIIGLRVLVGAAPAVLLVIGAVLLMIVALPLDSARREYALLGVGNLVDLAWVIVGLERPRADLRM